jgi:hypothetical protein
MTPPWLPAKQAHWAKGTKSLSRKECKRPPTLGTYATESIEPQGGGEAPSSTTAPQSTNFAAGVTDPALLPGATRSEAVWPGPLASLDCPKIPPLLPVYIHSLIPWIFIELLPGTVLNARDVVVNKIDQKKKNPFPH